MPCADNFTDSLPHPAAELAWLTHVIEFTQPRNVFGNYSFSLYIEDSSNQTSVPVTIKFGIMEMPCRNNGTCQGIARISQTSHYFSFIFKNYMYLFVCLLLF